MVSVAESNRADVALAVKELIATIKEVDGGASAIADDAVLFTESGEPSPLEFDSLDALDLALGLQERFDPHGERFQTFLNGDIDPSDLATIDRIVTYVMSVMEWLGSPIRRGNRRVSDPGIDTLRGCTCFSSFSHWSSADKPGSRTTRSEIRPGVAAGPARRPPSWSRPDNRGNTAEIYSDSRNCAEHAIRGVVRAVPTLEASDVIANQP